jgi:hypothetical protein
VFGGVLFLLMNRILFLLHTIFVKRNKLSVPALNVLVYVNYYRVKVKGKAIPLQAFTGPDDSRRLRLPDIKTIGTSRWQGCQP